MKPKRVILRLGANRYGENTYYLEIGKAQTMIEIIYSTGDVLKGMGLLDKETLVSSDPIDGSIVFTRSLATDNLEQFETWLGPGDVKIKLCEQKVKWFLHGNITNFYVKVIDQSCSE